MYDVFGTGVDISEQVLYIVHPVVTIPYDLVLPIFIRNLVH